MEIPSKVEVPLPISSNNIKLRLEILFMMEAVSFISTINVDSPLEILSLAPTLVNILSTIPILASLAGTNFPSEPSALLMPFVATRQISPPYSAR